MPGICRIISSNAGYLWNACSILSNSTINNFNLILFLFHTHFSLFDSVARAYVRERFIDLGSTSACTELWPRNNRGPVIFNSFNNTLRGGIAWMPWSATVRDREFKFCADSHRPTVFLSRGSCSTILLACKERKREVKKPDTNSRSKTAREKFLSRHCSAFVQIGVSSLFPLINVSNFFMYWAKCN